MGTMTKTLNEYRRGQSMTRLHAALERRGYSYSLETVRRWFRGQASIPLCVVLPIAQELRLTQSEVQILIALAAEEAFLND